MHLLTRQIDPNCCWRLRQCARARYPRRRNSEQTGSPWFDDIAYSMHDVADLMNFKYFVPRNLFGLSVICSKGISRLRVTAAALNGELLARVAAWS